MLHAGAEPGEPAALREAYRRGGPAGFWRWRLAVLQKNAAVVYVSPYDFASLYVALGEKYRAFEWLDKAYRERSKGIAGLKIDVMLDSLRADERFADLLKRMRLPAG